MESQTLDLILKGIIAMVIHSTWFYGDLYFLDLILMFGISFPSFWGWLKGTGMCFEGVVRGITVDKGQQRNFRSCV